MENNVALSWETIPDDIPQYLEDVPEHARLRRPATLLCRCLAR
jgi:hypothetical protein